MNYKLTVDVNLMNEEPKIPAVEKLKRWKEEGKIELVEADPPRVPKTPAYGWPGAPPKPPPEPSGFRGRTRSKVRKDPPGGLNFKAAAAVLFPTKDSQKLNMGEINDVVHLVNHHNSKNEIFVTRNMKEFIEGGKRERLKASFGVIAMTPEEAVALLGKTEGWK